MKSHRHTVYTALSTFEGALICSGSDQSDDFLSAVIVSFGNRAQPAAPSAVCLVTTQHSTDSEHYPHLSTFCPLLQCRTCTKSSSTAIAVVAIVVWLDLLQPFFFLFTIWLFCQVVRRQSAVFLSLSSVPHTAAVLCVVLSCVWLAETAAVVAADACRKGLCPCQTRLHRAAIGCSKQTDFGADCSPSFSFACRSL